MERAHIVGIIIDGTEACIYDDIPIKYIHSNESLTRGRYKFVGEVPIEELTGEETVVVIDAFAYRQRHQENQRIKRLRMGGYEGFDKRFYSFKMVGIIDKNNQLKIVTEPSNKRVEDIAPRMPVRQTGIFAAIKKIAKATGFSSTG